MRKLIIILTLAFSASIFGQTSGDKKDAQIVVNESDLTPAQLATIKARQQVDNIKAQAAAAGVYAKAVDEFGTGVAEASHELTDGAIKFGQTKLGRTTMLLVGVHVLGADFMGYLVGIPLVVFLVHVFLVAWRRNCTAITYVQEIDDRVDPAKPLKNGGVRSWFHTHDCVKSFSTAESMETEWHWCTLGFFAGCLVISLVIIFG